VGARRRNVLGTQTPPSLCGISVGGKLVALQEAIEAATFHLG
jgi:hypothetical protein